MHFLDDLTFSKGVKQNFEFVSAGWQTSEMTQNLHSVQIEKYIKWPKGFHNVHSVQIRCAKK